MSPVCRLLSMSLANMPSRLKYAKAWAARLTELWIKSMFELNLASFFPLITSFFSPGFFTLTLQTLTEFYKCTPKPPPSPCMLSPLPEIVEMSSTNVNITLVCESGFLQGASKWMKTSEPIVFCHRTPFKCSSSTFPIVMKVLRLREGPDWMSERCRQCPCYSAVTPTFFSFFF